MGCRCLVWSQHSLTNYFCGLDGEKIEKKKNQTNIWEVLCCGSRMSSFLVTQGAKLINMRCFLGLAADGGFAGGEDGTYSLTAWWITANQAVAFSSFVQHQTHPCKVDFHPHLVKTLVRSSEENKQKPNSISVSLSVLHPPNCMACVTGSLEGLLLILALQSHVRCSTAPGI